LKEYLDLDPAASLRLALKLTIDIDKKSEYLFRDFDAIADFCIHNEIGITNANCAEIAGDISLVGVKYDTKMSPIFVELYNYLTSKDGPNLPTYQALKDSKEIIQNGPASKDNFINAYKFAIKESGLAFDRAAAISFAKELSKKSFIKNEETP